MTTLAPIYNVHASPLRDLFDGWWVIESFARCEKHFTYRTRYVQVFTGDLIDIECHRGPFPSLSEAQDHVAKWDDDAGLRRLAGRTVWADHCLRCGKWAKVLHGSDRAAVSQDRDPLSHGNVAHCRVFYVPRRLAPGILDAFRLRPAHSVRLHAAVRRRHGHIALAVPSSAGAREKPQGCELQALPHPVRELAQASGVEVTAERIARRHEDHYGGRGPTIPMDQCWFCQREDAVCRTKQVFNSARYAHEYADYMNEHHILDKPVFPYQCHVCDLWHLTSRVNKTRARRLKKAERKRMRA